MNIAQKLNTHVSLKFWVLIVTIVLFIFLGLAIGYGLPGSFSGLLPNNNQISEVHQSGYKYISPLLECNGPNLNNKDSRALVQEINNIIADQIQKQNATDVSVYIRDLNNGPWIGINNDERFSPASLLKVPIMISYFKLAEQNPNLLTNKIRVAPIDPNALSQNIPAEKIVKGGQEYTTLDLVTRMIDYSDNYSADALLDNINPQDMDQIYSDLNIQLPTNGQMENFMTVRDYASFFEILYNASYLNSDMSELALKILSNVDFQNGLAGGLPAGISVAHKFGERDIDGVKQLHDCGIVYIPNTNYLICVMTRGQQFPPLEHVIQLISATTYKYFSKYEQN